jgi:hypothetical protein
MNMKCFIIIISLLTFGLAACEKDPGPGGTSSITGKIWVLDYNAEYTHLNVEYFASKEDVYLIYGDDNVYSESFKTNYDGTYKFDHLQKGKYKVFCYSEDTTGKVPGGKFAVIREVEITSNRQDVTVELIKIVK